HRAVVVAGVAGDVAPAIDLGDAAAALADDHGDLALVVEHGRLARQDHRLAVADLGVGAAREDRGLLRRLTPAFDAVLLVVQADAEDLLRPPDHRQERHGIEPVLGLALLDL